ncbi:MAG: exo-alpha-sialidase [Candidatus Hydrogenedentes bacterium]|nr:exo-alpha-sialidase [Candidatus Hydrogenedentota bacterium]
MLRQSIVVLAALIAPAMVCGQENASVFVSGEGGYHTYRIPALIASDAGTLLAFCEGRKTSPSDAGDIDLLLKRSTDNGVTWSEQQVVYEEGGDAKITIGNPCPVAGAEGVVHLLFTRDNARVFYVASRDDGATWSTPREITAVFAGFDFPWTRVGTGPGHGLRLSSGRLLVPLWLNERTGQNYRSAVLYSDDDGVSWQAGGLLGPEVADTNECMAVELPGGAVYLNMRAQKAPFRVVAGSTDRGETWSVPVPDQGLPGPVCQASVLRVGGRVFFANPTGPGRTNLAIKMSDDGAQTWRQLEMLHEGPSAYSDLALSPDGNLLCLYEGGTNKPYEAIRISRIALRE